MSCFLPIAIPQCLIEETHGEEGVQDVDMVLNPPGADNVGWMRPDGNPNANWLRGQIRDCEQDGDLAMGDIVDLNNGVINSALSELADAVETGDTSWDSSVWGPLPAQAPRSGIARNLYGGTWEAPAVVFDDPSYCQGGGGEWTGTAQVSGFVWVAVYDVVTSGPASERTIRTRIDTTRSHKVGTGSGGLSYGVEASGGARMVR